MGELSAIPILRLGDVLLASVQRELDDSTALAFANELTQRITETTARGVVLDISKLEIVDSFIARVLVEIAAMARLLGAQMVVAGMRPAVAITIVELGLALPGVQTALTAERALEKLAVRSSWRPGRTRDEGPGGAAH